MSYEGSQRISRKLLEEILNLQVTSLKAPIGIYPTASNLIIKH